MMVQFKMKHFELSFWGSIESKVKQYQIKNPTKIKLRFRFNMEVFLRSCGKVQFSLGQPKIYSSPRPLSWSSHWIKKPAIDSQWKSLH